MAKHEHLSVHEAADVIKGVKGVDAAVEATRSISGQDKIIAMGSCSGGITLFADMRAMKLLATFRDAKTFNDALAPGAAAARPFAAADLLRGYRLDVWDSFTQA